MKNIDKTGFRNASNSLLSPLSIGALRVYARKVGVAVPTTKKKKVLIEEIIAIFCGELEPIERSRRGAPVLDDRVDPIVEQKMENYRLLYLSGGGYAETQEKDLYSDSNVPTIDLQAELKKIRANQFFFEVEDPNRNALDHGADKEIRKGQLQTLNGVSMLLPLNCIDGKEKTVISVDLIRQYNLREGDVVTCFVARNQNINVANRIMTINGKAAENYQRFSFEDAEACDPNTPIALCENGENCAVTLKFFEWLAPIYHGQRGCIFSSPKAGKTQIIAELVKAIRMQNHDARVLTLLIDESPETVSKFRKITTEEELVYTTYEDEPERQVFVADYILKRAKRYAESGKKVVLLVDSLSALAKAYNETDASMGGKTLAHGLESKTLHYIKKYFGAARCFEQGGSLTIISTSSCGTGNPVDDLISAELSTLANFETTLSTELAMKHCFPALDLAKTYRKTDIQTRNMAQIEIERLLRGKYLSTHGAEEVLKILSDSSSFSDFENTIKKSL